MNLTMPRMPSLNPFKRGNDDDELDLRDSAEASDKDASRKHFEIPDIQRPFRTGRIRARLFIKGLAWLAAIVAFGVGMLHTSMFRIEQVDVVGATHLSREDVLRIAKVTPGESIAVVNSDKAERRLEAHPWVLHARVDVKWPHAVNIKVVEQRAVAIAPTSDKKFALLGPDGTVLSITDVPEPNFPGVLDLTAPAKVGEKVEANTGGVKDSLQVATLMPQSLQPHVVQIQNQSGLLKLGLRSGTVVTLGDAGDLPDKLLSAAAVVSQTDPKTLAHLDVTSPRFPVAEPKPEGKATSSSSQSKSQSQTKSTTTTTSLSRASQGSKSSPSSSSTSKNITSQKASTTTTTVRN